MVTVTTKMVKRQVRDRMGSAAPWGVIVLAAVQAPVAYAAEWRIVPRVELRETYSDNATLAQGGNRRSDFITEISPAVSVNATGPRFRLNADYALRNSLYANEGGSNNTQHQLSARTNAELVDDMLFMDGSASISTQSISAFGPQAGDTIHNTGNQTRVSTFNISPYLRNRFGTTAFSEVRYTHYGTGSGVSGLSNAQTDQISANLTSGPSFRTLGWGFHYNKSNTNYTDLQSQHSQNASGNLRYRINEQVSLTAAGGYEEFSYVSTNGDKPAGNFWSTGFAWTPTERTRLEANIGRRFYGTSRFLSASNRSRIAVSSINYSEDITTTQSQFQVPVTVDTNSFLNQLFAPNIADPVLRQQAVDAFIRNTGLPRSLASSVNTLSNRIFLQKSLQASIAFNISKSTVVVSAYNTTRQAQTGAEVDVTLLATNNFAVDGDNRTTGVSALWNWRLSPNSSMNLGSSYSRTKALTSDRKDDNVTLSLGISKQFQPKLRGSLEVRRLQGTSNQIGDTRENLISALLSMQL